MLGDVEPFWVATTSACSGQICGLHFFGIFDGFASLIEGQ